MADQLRTTEQLKAIARRAVEAISTGDLKAMEGLCAANVVWHQSPQPDVKGAAAYIQNVADCRSAFPDLRFTIDELIAEGNTTAVRYTWRGTHKGTAQAFPPPTGKQVTVTGCIVTNYLDGKIIEEWNYPDSLGLLQQLGAVPAQPPA